MSTGIEMVQIRKDILMKALVLAAAIIVGSLQATAYSPTYTKIAFGVHTQVETNTKALSNAKVVSLQIDLNNSTGSAPVVQISDRDQKNCSHKQTLISFSGYDMVAKKYKRTYEIQIEREPSKHCYVVVYASATSADKSRAARVSIFPSK
jgi:hypothetical protein